MTPLLQAAKAVYHAYNRTDGRAPILSVHMPELLKAIEEAEATSARWSDEEIERVASILYPPVPSSLHSDYVAAMKAICYLNEQGFLSASARDHALLSGEGEDKMVSWMDAEAIADLPNVHEALDNFQNDPTSDNATCLVRLVMLAATPPTSQVDQTVGCIGEDNLVRTHKESETCDVCAPVVDQGVTMSREPVRLPMNRYRYIVLISGGLGPDVWDKETTIEANDLLQAASVAHEAAIECGGHVVHIEQDDELTSTEVSAPMDPAPSTLEKEPLRVDDLANEIRRVDGSNSLGAGALAEALMTFLKNHSNGN